MPVWFLVLLLVILAFAIVLANGMAYSLRGAGGQNTTLIERDSSTTTTTES